MRYAASWAATIGLIILWSFPVAFVGLITNVSSLCATVSWMSWLCDLPVPVNVRLFLSYLRKLRGLIERSRDRVSSKVFCLQPVSQFSWRSCPSF
jgi:hypothetical protein